jgi:hypothetical protein
MDLEQFVAPLQRERERLVGEMAELVRLRTEKSLELVKVDRMLRAAGVDSGRPKERTSKRQRSDAVGSEVMQKFLSDITEWTKSNRIVEDIEGSFTRQSAMKVSDLHDSTITKAIVEAREKGLIRLAARRVLGPGPGGRASDIYVLVKNGRSSE